jgi:hypothetical protein
MGLVSRLAGQPWRRESRFLAALAIVLLCGAGNAARADDEVALLTGHLRAAASGVKSFIIMQTITGRNGVTTTVTFVRPASVKILTMAGPTPMIELDVVDGLFYMRSSLSGWRKGTLT